MKWWLVAALLLYGPARLVAQALPAPSSASTEAAFELHIEAPDDLREMLERHLELLRYRALADLSDSELDRLLTAARQDTQNLVATLGYFSPDIHTALRPATESTSRVVHLSVTPGDPTVMMETRITFSSPMDTDPTAQALRQHIEATWLLRPGMRFTQTAWSAAKQQALLQLIVQRYPTGRIAESQADIDPATHQAHVSLTLDAGPAYQLGGLVISGLQRFDAALVTRLARLTPGADYDQTQLVEAQQRLSDSGYFDSVFLSLDTSADPQRAPVLVQLREARLQKLVLGLGASTDSGARLSAEHTHHQVPGLGWRAVSKLSLDRETRSIGSELTAPPDQDNWRWVTSALLLSQQDNGFNTTSQRLRAGRSQNGTRIDRNYYLQYDRASTAASDASAPVIADALSANYAFTVRNFDSLPFPSRGWGLGVELGGGTTLGSQRDPYTRVLAHWLAYYPLGEQKSNAAETLRAGRLALRAQAGAVLAREGIALPSTQLFLTGGDNSVRGYGYRDLGVTQADGQTVAGRYLAVGSVEWQRPIVAQGRLTDWEGTAFIDAGAVADQPGELRAKVGVGLGARWKSPVGPLQMDVAYGVAVKRFRLHLNVGFSF